MDQSKPLRDLIARAPRPHDAEAAARLREAWGAEWSALSKDEAALVEGAAGCSPYLRRLMSRDAVRTANILRASPAEALDAACAAARDAGRADVETAMLLLRGAKKTASLVIALADLAGAADVMQTTRALTAFADAAVDAAMKTAAIKNGLEGEGIASIAMGKLGAHELNYSSDIDLIIVYDAAAMRCGGPADAKDKAVRVARQLVALLQNQTADGYVLRTDLRLRPDPGVTALAVSTAAAEAYYESFGQNWERMAFIKARAHAGDVSTGAALLNALRPFVWRKYLDFAAIEDVKAVKRQIHSSKGGRDIEFAGHDLKTGRGGIREIEFFAQTQQLILGGKNDALRLRGTLEALRALSAEGHVTEHERDDLMRAYRYLRHVEHRLQMINDEQIHKVPTEQNDIDRAACFCGEANAGVFEDKLRSTLETVKRHFDALFSEDAEEVAQPGPLVFTGVEGDPATLQTLESLGFARAREISRVIRRWHAGGVRATRTERARNILTKLMAPLLLALSKSSDPDAAFFAFDEFLARLPSGVQIFSLLANNLELFDSLIEIITVSPFLGREMSRRANFIETLVEGGLSASLPPEADYRATLESELEETQSYEDKLNGVRRWAGEAKFSIAAKLAAGALHADVAARHLTAIADVSIKALARAVKQEMIEQHGAMEGALVVLALGRLGAGEMTVGSDIDLMFVYDAPEGARSAGAGDGGKALGGADYFTREVRRLVTALSVATEEGGLYEVDMALRPSGSAGPAAVSFSAFRRYYEQDAWTWEMMALTRARIVAGDKELADRVNREIQAILVRKRDAAAVATDVNDMRRRLMRAKPGKGLWDVKHTVGGLTEIAFITQYLLLTAGAVHGRGPVHTLTAIEWLEAHGVLAKARAASLSGAWTVFDHVLHGERAGAGARYDPAKAGEALNVRMAAICGASSISEAESKLRRLQERVAQIYRQVLGTLPDDTC